MYIGSIKTASPFKDLFPIRKRILDDIYWDMQRNGFDISKPIVLWKDHDNIVIDGHTRLQAAQKAKIVQVSVVLKTFPNEEAALKYAIESQKNRRNLSDNELVACVVELDKRRDKMQNLMQNRTEAPCGASGKSATETASLLGVSTRKVERIRSVMDNADDDIKRMVKTGRMTVNSAYNRTVGAKRNPNGNFDFDDKELTEFCNIITKRFDRERMRIIMDFIAKELEKTETETKQENMNESA